MQYPSFFDEAPRLVVRDPLSDFLGSAEGGVIEYCYADAVKLTGHSCPTVALAYLATLRALGELYGDELPVRGDVAVRIAQPISEGVAGVTAAVCGLLTGAAGDGGFAGIGGRYVRRGLLAFGSWSSATTSFRRCDTGGAVVVRTDASVVPGDPATMMLLRKIASEGASPEDEAAFKAQWQDRVRAMLIDRAEDPHLIRIERMAAVS